MSRLLIGATACALVLNLTACTSSGGKDDRTERRVPSFAELDTSGDGQLSPDEFSRLPHRRLSSDEVFNRVDIDKDGYISRVEFARFREQVKNRINNRRG